MPSVSHPARPLWAEVSASQLRANYVALSDSVGPAIDVLAVIKADAYGHGAAVCAPILAAAGARWLGVTSVQEGIEVRRALGILPQGMTPRILVMCGIWHGEAAACVDYGLTPVVWEQYQLDLLEFEASQRGLPSSAIAVHLEIDTGMARQGAAPGPLLDQLLLRFTKTSSLLLEGVSTHLASGECAWSPQNSVQLRSFEAALDQLRAAGHAPAFVHVGNTSMTDSGLAPQELPALAQRLGARAMTRAGLGLYGYALALEAASPQLAPSLTPVMTWKSRVISLRAVKPGATVGYNAAFIASDDMRLALLPVGYADGFRRALSSSSHQPGGAVLLHGCRAPIVGRVSMNLTIVDVTAIPDVAIGNEAVLLGGQGADHISADEHACLANTSVYEVLCGISAHIRRVITD